MKEKERYEWDEIKWCEFIRDTGIDNRPFYYDLKAVVHILNQQDKHIKELEEENKQLKECIGKQFDRIQTLTKAYNVEKEFVDNMFFKKK